MAGWFKLLAVSAVVMGMSHTIAKERIFAPLRDRLGGKETFFGYLLSCPYCVSHYLAFLLVPLTGAYFVPVSAHLGIVSRLLTWFFSSILITVVAAFFRVVFWYVDEAQGLTRTARKKEEKELEEVKADEEQLKSGRR